MHSGVLPEGIGRGVAVISVLRRMRLSHPGQRVRLATSMLNRGAFNPFTPIPGSHRSPHNGAGITLALAFFGVFLIAFVKGAFGGGFAIAGIPLLSLVMDPIEAGTLLAPLF